MFKRRNASVASAATSTTLASNSTPLTMMSPTTQTVESLITNSDCTTDDIMLPSTCISGPLNPSLPYPNGSLSDGRNGNVHQHHHHHHLPLQQHLSLCSSSSLSSLLPQSSPTMQSSTVNGKVHGKRLPSFLLRLRHQSMTRRTILLLFSFFCLFFLCSSIQSTGHTTFTPSASVSNTSHHVPSDEHEHPPFELESVHAPVCNPLTSTEDVTYTLVTQLSYDRLWMMQYHCQRYPHPTAIAVYTSNSLETILEELRTMGCPVDEHNNNNNNNIEKDQKENFNQEKQPKRDDDENLETDDRRLKGPSQEHPHHKGPLLQVAVLDSKTHGKDDDYPVNDLRNLALSLVQSTYIIYIDVDFWTSDYLYETLSTETVQKRLIQDPQHAVVIPAFQLYRQCWRYKDCRDKNIPRMPRSLTDLADMIKNKRGHIFDPTNKGGHGSTDYKAWFRQHPGSLRDIQCLQSNRYEPFVAIRYCRDMPPFQQAFSGYGKNKVTWMMQAIASGYTLSQVGGVYLVHYPHLESVSRARWNESPKELKVSAQEDMEEENPNSFNIRRPTLKDGDLHFAQYKRGQVDRIFLEFKDWLGQSIPSHRARLRLCDSAQDDDWKLWVDPKIKERRKKQREGGKISNTLDSNPHQV